MSIRKYRHNQGREYRVNYRIRVPKVRLIGNDGKQFGIVNRDEAIKIAKGQNLDLVEIVPNASPPVCRIMDFKKFLYEQKKKEKEIKKKRKTTQLKEIRFTPTTSEHDYKFKKHHIENFLKEGNRVKVIVFFKGRAILHKEKGYELIEKLINDLRDIGKVEISPKMEGNRLSVTFIPL